MSDRMSVFLAAGVISFVLGYKIGQVLVPPSQDVTFEKASRALAYSCGAFNQLVIEEFLSPEEDCDQERWNARMYGFHAHDTLDIHLGAIDASPKNGGM